MYGETYLQRAEEGEKQGERSCARGSRGRRGRTPHGVSAGAACRARAHRRTTRHCTHTAAHSLVARTVSVADCRSQSVTHAHSSRPPGSDCRRRRTVLPSPPLPATSLRLRSPLAAPAPPRSVPALIYFDCDMRQAVADPRDTNRYSCIPLCHFS